MSEVEALGQDGAGCTAVGREVHGSCSDSQRVQRGEERAAGLPPRPFLCLFISLLIDVLANRDTCPVTYGDFAG